MNLLWHSGNSVPNYSFEFDYDDSTENSSCGDQCRRDKKWHK